MTYPLQQFNFDKSAYERPTQRWVCGWTEEGRPCQIGPDRHGRCRATFHCQPIKKGDRWHCTRSPNYGGPCEEGPRPDGACCRPIPPCQPVRSMRARRVLAVRLTIALTIAMVVVAIFGPFGEDFISPGPLTAAHATTADSCRSCHSAAHGQAAAWIAAAWNSHSDSNDDALCLNCHKVPEAVRLVASMPHSMSLADLLQLRAPRRAATADRSAASGAEVGGGSGVGGEPVPWRLIAADRLVGDEMLMAGQAACATCHREHHGREQSLTNMDNGQCQACHDVKFDSFVHGHPEFSDSYPHTRRTRIAFNHAKHAVRLGDPAVNGPKLCSDCHTADATHRHMVLRGFDASCSACHGRNVASRGAIDFIKLPTVDHKALSKAGLWIGRTDPGTWPPNADFDDNDMTGFLKLMLAADADPAVAESIAILERGKVKLSDLARADAAALQAAARVVWSIKALMHEFGRDGESAFRRRLEGVFKRDEPLGDSAFAGLIGQPPDAARQDEQTLAWNLQQAITSWMSGLDEDVTEFRADPGKMTSHAGTPSESPPPPERKPEPTPAPAPGSDEILLDDEPVTPDKPATPGTTAAATADDEELVADDEVLIMDDKPATPGPTGAPGSPGASGAPGTPGVAPAGDEELVTDDEVLIMDEPPAPPGTAAATTPAAVPPAGPPEPEAATLTERAGRWHLRPEVHAIVYMPSGHADAFLKNWLDATAATSQTSAPRTADALFRRLSDRESGPGRCGDCHSVDRPAGQDRYEINWRGQRPESPEHSLTNFAHGPHFNRPELRNCQACHDYRTGLNPAVWQSAYSQYDPHQIAPNLTLITKSKCVSCHTPQGAGDSCLMCHKYHRTEMAATPTSARLAEHRGAGESTQPRPGPDQK